MNYATPTSPRGSEPQDPRPDGDAPRARRARLFVVSAALALLVVAAGAAWWLYRSDDGEGPAGTTPAARAQDGASPGGLAAKDLDGDGIVYQSGMHPWIVEDAPGPCPVCGMDLQPVPVSGAPEGTVEIDPVTLQNIGVRTATVTVRTLERTLRTTGTFEPVDGARTAVSLKVGGWIERLYVNAEGNRVRQGQPLLELYSPELVATQEEYLLALRSRELLGDGGGDRLVEAAARRLVLFGIGPEQIRRLGETGEVQRTLTFHAPASGTVVDKRVVTGQQAPAGMLLMEIVDFSRLWVQADVPEQDLGWVDVGTRAVVTIASRPGEELRGRVDYIYDTLDPATRTGTARITVPNPGRRLKPGMYGVATLFGAPSPAHPTVPVEAVVRTGEEAVVILAAGEGRFRPQPVTLGAEADGFVQVLSGLTGGETVVTSAQFLIDSEARLSSAVGAMSGAGEKAPSDAQAVQISVESEGFTPARIPLTRDVPARLVFTRRTDDTCATTIAIPGLGVGETPLPFEEPVAIDVTPRADGTFTFVCGMDMIEGALLVSS